MDTPTFEISVIIPVYNAARFVEGAVASAINQPEVVEVILVEDGSKDNSLEICEKLEQDYTAVKLYRHPNGENRGAGASRNLGIEKASAPFIAFLDADDLYLPGRFTETRKKFEENPDAHGVHEVIGARFYEEDLRERHLERVRWEETGLRKHVNPYHLFRTLATGKYGHIHLDGLVLRRSALNGTLRFDTSLRQCQDSDLMLRLATTRVIYAGDTDNIVALRGVHPDNRVFNESEALRFRSIYLKKCIDNMFYGSEDGLANLYIVTRYIGTLPWVKRWKWLKVGGFELVKLTFTGLYLLIRPKVAFYCMNAIVVKHMPRKARKQTV